MVLFHGVVEDIKDPEQMGRVRVRCFGIHTEDTRAIKTEDLPWSLVMLPTTSASISGVSQTHQLVAGSWVVGFFADGESAQDPVIMGSVPGNASEKPSTEDNIGFKDPDLVHPKWVGEPDLSKLTRGEEILERDPSPKIGEPASPFAPEYPHNHVMQTESGHFKEYDDTPSKERIRESHMSGSYYEIFPNGDKVEHVVGSSYRVIMEDDKVHIKGNVEVYIDGDAIVTVTGDNITNVLEGNSSLNVIKGHLTANILEGDATTIVGKGDATLSVDLGNVTTNVALGNFTANIDLGATVIKSPIGGITLDGTAGGITILGPVTTDNVVTTGGLITSGGDVVSAKGISLDGHTHAVSTIGDINPSGESNPPS